MKQKEETGKGKEGVGFPPPNLPLCRAPGTQIEGCVPWVPICFPAAQLWLNPFKKDLPTVPYLQAMGTCQGEN